MERRLAAILEADVAGYSGLMEADEEGTLARLNVLRCDVIEPLIEKNHGRVVKLMGDGLLAEFGSAVDAVRCGAEIQQGIHEKCVAAPDGQLMKLRIGVNLGDIIIQDGDIFGDGVNVAARLQQLARPGSVAISDDVYRQVESRLDLDYEDLGEHRVRNIKRRVHAYRVIAHTEESVAREAPARNGVSVRRLAIAAILGCAIAGGLAAWLILSGELMGPAEAVCTDHLGLPVKSDSCPIPAE